MVQGSAQRCSWKRAALGRGKMCPFPMQMHSHWKCCQRLSDGGLAGTQDHLWEVYTKSKDGVACTRGALRLAASLKRELEQDSRRDKTGRPQPLEVSPSLGSSSFGRQIWKYSSKSTRKRRKIIIIPKKYIVGSWRDFFITIFAFFVPSCFILNTSRNVLRQPPEWVEYCGRCWSDTEADCQWDWQFHP